jgi:transcriptional regulator with XRE-family HTH domain
MTMTLGRVIAEARKAAGLSQKDLAARTLREDGQSMSAQFLNDIERDRRRPGPVLLAALAEQLNLNADELHLLAGQVPPDLLEGLGDETRRKAAAKAFRKTIAG